MVQKNTIGYSQQVRDSTYRLSDSGSHTHEIFDISYIHYELLVCIMYVPLVRSS
jgi:hypothetical protein